jgi:hypothetical protein
MQYMQRLGSHEICPRLDGAGPLANHGLQIPSYRYQVAGATPPSVARACKRSPNVGSAKGKDLIGLSRRSNHPERQNRPVYLRYS